MQTYAWHVNQCKIRKTEWHDRVRRWFIFAITACVITTADQIVKGLIRKNLNLGEQLLEFGPLKIVHLQNTGSAWGFFTDFTLVLSIISIIGLLLILIFIRYIPRESILGNLSLGLIFGGALGNLIDRLRLGYVTDFIYVRVWHDFYWPAFNVADSAITVGAIILVFFIIFGMKQKNSNVS
jgi:signal peptidase II